MRKPSKNECEYNFEEGGTSFLRTRHDVLQVVDDSVLIVVVVRILGGGNSRFVICSMWTDLHTYFIFSVES